MSYVAKTFIAGEQPSAAEWNKLTANDASFHDGTGIDDNVIIARHLDLITRTGWLPLTALTRTADTTVTLSGDWTDRITVGSKLRWLSAGSARYNYIVGLSYSAGTGLTTLTITTGYITAANDMCFKSGDAITVPQFSLVSNPVGFPQWFKSIPVADVTTLDNGSGAQPAIYSSQFKITERKVTALAIIAGANNVKAGTAGLTNYVSLTSLGIGIAPNATMTVGAYVGAGSWDNGSNYAPHSVIYRGSNIFWLWFVTAINDNTVMPNPLSYKIEFII